jgi:hypothetical protein
MYIIRVISRNAHLLLLPFPTISLTSVISRGAITFQYPEQLLSLAAYSSPVNTIHLVRNK